jgi:hypothetical protein
MKKLPLDMVRWAGLKRGNAVITHYERELGKLSPQGGM